MSLKYSGKKQKSHPIRSLLLLTQPSVAILAIMVVLMQWRVPTSFRLTLWTELPQTAEIRDVIAEMQTGRIISSQIREIEIHYPAFPKIRPARFTELDNFELEPLGKLRVIEREHDSARHEVLWQLEGSASHFSIRSGHVRRDLRLTRFDLLLHSRWTLYGVLAGWILFTALAWFKLYQELRAE